MFRSVLYYLLTASLLTCGVNAQVICDTCSAKKNCFCVFNNNCHPPTQIQLTSYINKGIRERVDDATCNQNYSCVEIPENNEKHSCGTHIDETENRSAISPTFSGKAPWLVNVVESLTNTVLSFGTIIHPKVVMTTKHNIHEYNQSTLMVITRVINTVVEDFDLKVKCAKYQQFRKVKKVINHGKYVSTNHNDISLLILDEPLILNRNVSTVCLSREKPKLINQELYHWSDSTGSKSLLSLNMTVWDDNECVKILKEKRHVHIFYKLHESFFCAKGQSGTNEGDGGSPLIYKNEINRAVITGMLSFGIHINVPEIFVNVPKLVPWIEDELKKEGISLQIIS